MKDKLEDHVHTYVEDGGSVYVVRLSKRLFHLQQFFMAWARNQPGNVEWFWGHNNFKAQNLTIAFDSTFGNTFFYFLLEKDMLNFIKFVKEQAKDFE